MRNRAKCKLCSDIIESMHSSDLQVCTCGEISVDRGSDLGCAARNWANFLRVDDKGNEIQVKVRDESLEKPIQPDSLKPSKAEKLAMLEEMVKSYENLPQVAMGTSVTQYDIYAALLLVLSILKEDNG